MDKHYCLGSLQPFTGGLPKDAKVVVRWPHRHYVSNLVLEFRNINISVQYHFKNLYSSNILKKSQTCMAGWSE